jgi:transposase
MQISTIGIDIGKNRFHFVGFDARGGIVVRRQCSRTQLIRTLANLPPCLVGMEACCGAHHLGRILVAQGHDVRLIPPQYVKPFVKSQKNDLLDAEAIGEAVQRPTMRFVPLKTMEQLDLQAIHRLRTRPVARRTAVIKLARRGRNRVNRVLGHMLRNSLRLLFGWKLDGAFRGDLGLERR